MGFFMFIYIFISMKGKTLKGKLHIENILTELNNDVDFSSFKIKDELNPKIWENDEKMYPNIRLKLIKIAKDYWKSLELDFDYLDITMTGSLANYNWSRFSDVDLHLLFDINELGENKEMIKELLDVKTRKWNSDHNIKIKGFEVELYLQPEDQPHHSTGVYSLTNDEWISKPKKEVLSLDKENIRKKYKTIVKNVEDIENEDNEDLVISSVRKLKDKISNMRQAGLEDDGEYSSENIVFKMLRRNDIMEKLNDLEITAYDNSHTMSEVNINETRVLIKKMLNVELNKKNDIDEGLKSAALGGALALSSMLGGNLNANPNDIDNKPGISKTIESDKPIITLNGKEIEISLEDIIGKAKSLKNNGYNVGIGKSKDMNVAKEKALTDLNYKSITKNDLVYIVNFQGEGYYYIIIQK